MSEETDEAAPVKMVMLKFSNRTVYFGGLNPTFLQQSALSTMDIFSSLALYDSAEFAGWRIQYLHCLIIY